MTTSTTTPEPTDAATVLDVPVDAPADRVRAAFRALARQHHPDAGGDAASFRRLVTARDTLLEAGSATITSASPTTAHAAGTPVRVVNAYRRTWGPTATTGRWADVAA